MVLVASVSAVAVWVELVLAARVAVLAAVVLLVPVVWVVPVSVVAAEWVVPAWVVSVWAVPVVELVDLVQVSRAVVELIQVAAWVAAAAD